VQDLGSSPLDTTMVTPRLFLRPMVLEDAEAMHAFKSDPEATRSFGQEPHTDIEQTRGWVRSGLEGRKEGTSMTWAILLRDTDQVIGECCLWNIDHGSRRAELGYELLRSYWKRGLMSEALKSVLEYGFGEMGLNRIEANPLSTNLDSRKVLIGLGFKQEGILRQRYHHQGQWRDEMWFGLLQGEWAERTKR